MDDTTPAAPQSPTTSASPPPDSPASSASAIPSSSSSIVPPSTSPEMGTEPKAKRPKSPPKPMTHDRKEALAKLEAKIKALRAARKADGPDGRPAKNRQELIEARRKKHEKMQADKKAAKKVAKEEEQRLAAEAELAQMRGSSTPDIFAPRPKPTVDNFNFSFGLVAFDDGQQVDSKLGGLVASKKRKGPSDPRTALVAAQKKRARLNGLDEEKKAEIEEKDLWLNAKKKAHGEKVRDDASLLLKTLKRKKKTKQKSEKEWSERIEGVQHGKEMRQKKREANLQKRRDGKKDGKNKVKGSKVKKPSKKVKRPGFEGSFRSKAK